MRFSSDRRWAILAVAVLLGASGGSFLGFVTARPPGDEVVWNVAPGEQVAPSSTTRRPRARFAGVSSTTRPRPRVRPAATAGRGPATSSTPTSTVRPTTTTLEPTTTTTTGGATTTSSSAPSSTSTT